MVAILGKAEKMCLFLLQMMPVWPQIYQPGLIIFTMKSLITYSTNLSKGVKNFHCCFSEPKVASLLRPTGKNPEISKKSSKLLHLRNWNQQMINNLKRHWNNSILKIVPDSFSFDRPLDESINHCNPEPGSHEVLTECGEQLFISPLLTYLVLLSCSQLRMCSPLTARFAPRHFLHAANEKKKTLQSSPCLILVFPLIFVVTFFTTVLFPSSSLTAVTVCNHGNSQRLSRAYNR